MSACDSSFLTRSFSLFFSFFFLYSDLRSQRDEKTSNKESTCFICGIHRDQFDQDGQTDFKRHCAYEHNKWHYLFYLIHCQLLDEETPDDINAYERFVLNNFEEGDISWMPLQETVVLSPLDLVPFQDIQLVLNNLHPGNQCHIDLCEKRTNKKKEESENIHIIFSMISVHMKIT